MGLADAVADGVVRHRCLAPAACPPTHRGSGFPRSYPPRTATPGDRRSRPGWVSQKFTTRRHQLLLGDGDPRLGLCHVCLAVAAHVQLAGLLRSLQKFPAASTDFGVGRGAGVPSDGEIRAKKTLFLSTTYATEMQARRVASSGVGRLSAGFSSVQAARRSATPNMLAAKRRFTGAW